MGCTGTPTPDSILMSEHTNKTLTI